MLQLGSCPPTLESWGSREEGVGLRRGAPGAEVEEGALMKGRTEIEQGAAGMEGEFWVGNPEFLVQGE